MPEQMLRVTISSTARDLPLHRKEVLDACARQSMFPLMMEHLAASDADAIEVSLRMVDDADLYVGIFAHRYGYVPAGHDLSITEMEYNRAVERGIPRLIFLMHDDHPIKASDVEKGDGARKLETFKARLATERVVNFFKSPEDLRAHVINSLSQYRKPDLAALHYVSDIPAPPEAYIAHPYTLLQTKGLVGRQEELSLLTDWVAKPNADVYKARILNIVAIGGMGKSALTWKWFNEIAPLEMQPLVGRMWWSFYESDASFENFVTRALAYVSQKSKEEIRQLAPQDREAQLLAILDHEPFLLVLDGLERILVAYARMDAARLADDDLDQRTANVVAGALGLPESGAQSFTGQHRLRKTADPRVGNFLRRLANVRASRILVSTRLYPADLQTVTGQPMPGSFAYFLRGLQGVDALNLWRSLGVSGLGSELLPLFDTFERHPLLIQTLAGAVASYRKAPGNFDQWYREHSNFNPFNLPLVQVKSHVLQFALESVNEHSRTVLYTIAAFCMPAAYDTLVALLAGDGKVLKNERALDVALIDLEDRGLLGWNKRDNRYDLHPIVRGVTWGGINEHTKRIVYERLHTHFESLPATSNWKEVDNLEDLTSMIELYNTLVGLGRYDDALDVFSDRLNNALHYRLSASRQRAELLEMLFPDGLDRLPRLTNPFNQAFVFSALFQSYVESGQCERAVKFFQYQSVLQADQNTLQEIGMVNLGLPLLQSGKVYAAEDAVLGTLFDSRALGSRFHEAIDLQIWGLILTVRGKNEGGIALQRALRIFESEDAPQFAGAVNIDLCQRELWLGDPKNASLFLKAAWTLAQFERQERDFIRIFRLQGMLALALDDPKKADERLHQALTRARAINLVEEELPAWIGLAELCRRQGDPQAAREALDEVWESAERGPYPLFHADACNVLAQIERDVGNHGAAIEAATKAYRLAWCDGPPYAYHWGLEAARAHLQALGVPEPNDLPPFDPSKHEPMPEVEIDPPDEPERDDLSASIGFHWPDEPDTDE